MCPLHRALTMARRRVQRTAAAAGGWASWGGHGIGIHSPKVTLVLSLRVDLRWWMAVVDRGVVVCDEWGLVVASANIGEGGFCRNARLPTSIGTRLACAVTVTLLSLTSLLFCFHVINDNYCHHIALRLLDSVSHVDPVAILQTSCRIDCSAENLPTPSRRKSGTRKPITSTAFQKLRIYLHPRRKQKRNITSNRTTFSTRTTLGLRSDLILQYH